MSRSKKPSRKSSRPAPTPAPPPATPNPWLWAVLAVGSAAVYLAFYAQPGLLWWVGVQHYDVWFGDTLALLASNDAVTAGLNPFEPNPFDVFHRPHVYSHWWLELRHLGLTRADIVWIGPLVVSVAWLAALSVLRPRNGRQLGYYFFLLICSPFLLALERANNDLIVFAVLTPLVPCLMSQRAWVRFLAPALIALAAGLKYYPAAAGLALLAPPAKETRSRVLAGLALLALTALSVAPDLAIFGPLAPKPKGWMTFGATTLFQQLGWQGLGPTLLGLAAGAGLFVAAWRSPRLSGWTPAASVQADWLRFVTGAALLTGCFFTSGNFAYRWVFAFWLAPFLWSLAHDPAAPAPARNLGRLTQWLLLAALWLDTMFSWVAIYCQGRIPPDSIRSWIKWSLVGEQPVTWALFACLVLFLAHFTRDGVRRLFQPDEAGVAQRD